MRPPDPPAKLPGQAGPAGAPARPAWPGRRQVLLAGLGAAGLGTAAGLARAGAGPGVQVHAPGLDLPAELLAPGQPAQRILRVHLPAALRPGGVPAPGRRYPVIYLLDGQNLFDPATGFAGEWGVDEALDALAAATGQEAIAVGIDHGGERRVAELTPWPHPRAGTPRGQAFLGFVVDQVKPWVDARWPTLADAAHTALAGSSMGGLMAHYALHQRPEVFGTAGVLSPAYWIAPAVFAHTEARPRPATARIYLSAGGQEGGAMQADAERMAALLARQGPASAQALRWQFDASARHQEAAWRRLMPDLLRWWLAPLARA